VRTKKHLTSRVTLGHTNFVNILLFFVGLVVVLTLQLCFILVIVRSLRASIAAELLAVQDRVYSDLAGWFTPAKEGEASQLGLVVNGMAEVLADTLFAKVKMAAIGKVGGQAERTKKSGNPVMDLIMNYVTGGGLNMLAGAGQQALDLPANHSNNGNGGGFAANAGKYH